MAASETMTGAMELPAEVQTFLQQHDTMTLATVGPDGAPQAAAVFYAADQQHRLYFLSSPSSRHSQNLTGDPRVAATIHADGQPWREIRGLQIEGHVRQVTGAAAVARAAAVYVTRFAFLKPFADALKFSDPASAAGWTGIQRALADSRLYVLTPDWVRMVDNSQGFGHKTEWSSEI